MNKKIGFVLAGLWISFQALAQGTTTEQTSEKIKGDVYSGYSTRITGDFEEVHDALIKNLKTFGKVKEDRNSISVNSPTINGTTFQEKSMKVLARKNKDESCYLWIGIKTEDWDRQSLDLINSQMDQILKNFVPEYRRGCVQKKINETQSAWESIERLQSKTVKQASDLNKKLENNVKEKAHLEQSLVDNDKENVSLKARIVDNKKAQDSIANVLQQVKNKMAVHQDELSKIR